MAFNFNSYTVIDTPFGPVQSGSSDASLDGFVSTANGKFGTNGKKAQNPKDNETRKGVSVLKPIANYNGSLTKVSLTTTDLPHGYRKTFVLPYNPETVSFGKPTQFGEYSGVMREPLVYFSGQKVDRISIKFIVNDRAKGAAVYYDQVCFFADPNGQQQAGTSTKKQFSAPPLTTLSYGKIGSFKGYVEHPTFEPIMLDKDLKALIAYVGFTFVSVKRIAVPTATSAGTKNHGR